MKAFSAKREASHTAAITVISTVQLSGLLLECLVATSIGGFVLIALLQQLLFVLVTFHGDHKTVTPLGMDITGSKTVVPGWRFSQELVVTIGK